VENQIAPLALLVLLLATSTSAQQPAPPSCTSAEHKQLDFWVGDWDLTWPGAKAGEMAHGSNSIKRILDGCVVQESFSAGDSGHLRGTSVSMYDAAAHKWKQTWVDNEGGYLDFVGGMAGGEMFFQREAVKRDGSKFLQRMIWRNVTAGEFDWSWESSNDGGKSWQVQWPIHYKRKS
jgi:hypothetical protein